MITECTTPPIKVHKGLAIHPTVKKFTCPECGGKTFSTSLAYGALVHEGFPWKSKVGICGSKKEDKSKCHFK